MNRPHLPQVALPPHQTQRENVYTKNRSILPTFQQTQPSYHPPSIYGFHPEGVSVAYLLTVKNPVLPALQSAQVPLWVPLPAKPVGFGASELVIVKSAGTELGSSGCVGLWWGRLELG